MFEIFLPFLSVAAQAVAIVAVLLLAAYYASLTLTKLRMRSSPYYSTIKPEDVIPAEIKPRKCKVCVIGAGPAGIVTVKELLQEGHTVSVYEKNDTFGGVFLYRDYKVRVQWPLPSYR